MYICMRTRLIIFIVNLICYTFYSVLAFQEIYLANLCTYKEKLPCIAESVCMLNNVRYYSISWCCRGNQHQTEQWSIIDYIIIMCRYTPKHGIKESTLASPWNARSCDPMWPWHSHVVTHDTAAQAHTDGYWSCHLQFHAIIQPWALLI